MDKIMDRLYIGGYIYGDGDIKPDGLRREGIDAIVNVAKEQTILHRHRHGDWEVYKFPLEDYHFPCDHMQSHIRMRKIQRECANRCISTLSDLWDEGKTIVICCAAGASRSTIISMMFMHRKLGIPWTECREQILRVRPISKEYSDDLLKLLVGHYI